MEVPPPFAILQASRGAERRRISWQVEPGGGWRRAGALGKIFANAFKQRVWRGFWDATRVGSWRGAFIKLDDILLIMASGTNFWKGRGDEILCKKVKVLSLKSFCLLSSFIVSA